MRYLSLAPLALLAACDDDRREQPPPAPREAALTRGEERLRVTAPDQSAVTLRSGAQIPVRLPAGFLIYPGAVVRAHTMVEKAGKNHALVVFETSDPLAAVARFYRARAADAGTVLSMDIESDDRASLGGTTRQGQAIVLAAHRANGVTRIEFSVE